MESGANKNMLFFGFSGEFEEKGSKMTPGEHKSEKIFPKDEPKAAKRRQKEITWSPKVVQRELQGAKREPTGANWTPKRAKGGSIFIKSSDF